ncbi:MAG: hypothetical protein AAB364_03390 [Patescibacteria group bacterium]
MDKLKDIEKTSEKDSFSEYVRLKLSKLSSVVYLVTNFLPDQEPVKWLLRQKALGLIAQDLSQPLFGQIISEIEQILPPIELALLCPDVSKMNLSILKIEYLSLKQVLLDKHLNTQATLEQIPELAVPTFKKNEINEKPERLFVSSIRAKSPVISPRSGLILGLIKQKGPSSIKDIASNVRGVSSKTVQRELAELVRTGALRKEGEKRWSRYSLAG